jgi:HEAT repeat protein
MRHIMRQSVGALAIATMCVAPATAQTLSQRVQTTDGRVEIVYPSRAGACGDGRSYVGHVFGHTVAGTGIYERNSGWPERPCLPGPVRLEATVLDGEVTHLRAYVGPLATDIHGARTIEVSATEAAGWLGQLVASGHSRVASEAVLPLVLADAPDPWPLLLRVARDEDRPRGLRTDALFWLGNGVIDHLGLDDRAAETPDDEMRSQAVFVLSQRPRGESIPELVEIARANKHASARRAAIFWLGQSGDLRAADTFAELLGSR